MPVFIFTDPETGQEHEVEGPSGSTEAQARAVLQERLSARQTANAQAQQVRNQMFESSPWYEQAGSQFAQSMAETGEGIKDLVGLGDPSNQALIEMGRKMPFTPAGVGGYLASEVMQTMAPARAATIPFRAAGLGKYAPALADIGVAALQSALKLPTDGTRGEAAAMGGLGAVLGRGLNRFFSPGVTPTPDAAPLVKEGIRLTPGQAGGPIARGVESGLELLPFTQGAVRKAKEKAVGDWGSVQLNKVNPGAPTQQTGRRAVEDVAANFNREYRDLLGRVTIRGSDMAPAIRLARARATTGSTQLSPSQQRQFEATLGEFSHQLASGGVTDKAIKEWVTNLRNGAKKATKGENLNLGLERAYNEILDDFNRVVARKTGDPVRYGELDRAYAQFLPLKEAANSASAVRKEGQFSPAEVLAAMRKGEGRRITGELETAQRLLGEVPDKWSSSRLLGMSGLAGLGGFAAGGGPGTAAVLTGLLGGSQAMGPLRGLAVRGPGLLSDVGDASLRSTAPSQLGGMFMENEN